ncbi:tryptophan synthase subunit alpha [Salsuginibacillus kocurii]|uniref:tryptophan synthase subunit alpha n=1 Tax=Salsuginibacillus kocurii TaxID=427078 RepID=UPI00037A3DDA|nr:tryptophan synthase subunit alpha [Salsuginibacillus kocurii]
MSTIQEAANTAEFPLFIPFIMAGDPTPEATVDTALALQEAGAHILELGIPYSDPLADGPVIQAAAIRALKGGMTLSNALDLIPQMREKGVTIPIVVFTYYNPLLQLGVEGFSATAAEKGANGLLVPDLPLEESDEVKEAANRHDLSLISLVAPTSKERVDRIVEQAEGFLYIVSSLGVTGSRDAFHEQTHSFVEEVTQKAQVPAAVGFGVSKPEHVRALKGKTDGVIVGSAIVSLMGKLTNELKGEEHERKQALGEVKKFVHQLIAE